MQSSSQPFENLTDLVAYHKIKKSGLTTTLKEPCPKPQAVAFVTFLFCFSPASFLFVSADPIVFRTNDLSYETRDKWEVPREEIELVGRSRLD